MIKKDRMQIFDRDGKTREERETYYPQISENIQRKRDDIV